MAWLASVRGWGSAVCVTEMCMCEVLVLGSCDDAQQKNTDFSSEFFELWFILDSKTALVCP